MKTTHTPGPWRVEKQRSTFRISSRNGNPRPHTIIATTYDGSEESEANSKLIVRAVNSHEPLIEQCEVLEKVILRQIRIYKKSGDDEGVRLQTFSLIRLRDVLAAAREQ